MNSIDCTVDRLAFRKLDEICSPFGKTAVIVADNKTDKKAVNRIKASCAETVLTGCVRLNGRCTDKNINALCENKTLAASDLILACGGANALDTSKYASEHLGKKVLLLPTVSSGIACCSNTAVKTDDLGNAKHIHRIKKPVFHMFIDTTVLSDAPVLYLQNAVCEIFFSYYRAQGAKLRTEDAMAARERMKYTAMKLEHIAPTACNDNRRRHISRRLQETLRIVLADVRTAYSELYRDEGFFEHYGVAERAEMLLRNRLSFTDEQIMQIKAILYLASLLYCGDINEYYRFSLFCKSIGVPVKMSELKRTRLLSEAIAENIAKDGDFIDGLPYSGEKLKRAFEMLER